MSTPASPLEPPQKSMSLARKILLGTGATGVLFATLCCSTVVCLPAVFQHGVLVDSCPSGTPAQTVGVFAGSLRRGQTGWVSISPTAHYTTGPADMDATTQVRWGDVSLALVDATGDETELEPEDGWDRDRGTWTGGIALPAVPDGDYQLRARVDTPLGESQVDVQLPIYAPAQIHLLTDRPLYEPGNTMLFRAVLLRARDLTPMSGRPGSWRVSGPDGEVLLEERAVADDYGVVAGSFPLDARAESGGWTVQFVSGEDVGASTVAVEPFTLPRFSVEAQADSPWARPGDAPTVRGTVSYASGAPVPDAQLEVDWSVNGAWPAPVAWLTPGPGETGLPQRATSSRAGQFVLRLPEVPGDLAGRATLMGRIKATDPAGDVVYGAISLLLSEDPIQAEVVTELADGLVEGFNNRAYVRVADPAGTPLAGAEVVVSRAWDSTDKGQTGTADADGVVALQLDPGAPVNIVVPPLPVRPPPRTPPITFAGARDQLAGRPIGLAEQVVLERWPARLEACARFTPSAASTRIALDVGADGRLRDVVPAADPLARCIAQAVSGERLPAGEERLLVANFQASSTHLPALQARVETGLGSAPASLQTEAAWRVLDARQCVPEDLERTGWLSRALQWRVREGRTEVATRWVESGRQSVLDLNQEACVERSLAGMVLDTPAAEDGVGYVRVSIAPPARSQVARPQATTMLGYELKITATLPDDTVGSTVLRSSPGQVPNLRLRADPILPAAGDPVRFTFFRGPDFVGELPEKLWLHHEGRSTLEAELDEKSRSVVYTLPDDAEGWYELSYGGALARVYVQPKGTLDVALTADKDSYAPGETAVLAVQTTADGSGAPANVGLFGVDATLGQLVTLPGPDAMAGLRPTSSADSPAFGVLDGKALEMGRVRGENAAAATVLRISQVPTPAELDRYVTVDGSGRFDPVEDLTDRFYTVLAELHAQTRVWEQDAPADEKITPKKMVALWNAALGQAEAQGHDVTDAYGRTLRLGQLPPDLLALTAPEAVVVDGTRMTEDVENWAAWVAEENP